MRKLSIVNELINFQIEADQVLRREFDLSRVMMSFHDEHGRACVGTLFTKYYIVECTKYSPKGSLFTLTPRKKYPYTSRLLHRYKLRKLKNVTLREGVLALRHSLLLEKNGRYDRI